MKFYGFSPWMNGLIPPKNKIPHVYVYVMMFIYLFPVPVKMANSGLEINIIISFSVCGALLWYFRPGKGCLLSLT